MPQLIPILISLAISLVVSVVISAVSSLFAPKAPTPAQAKQPVLEPIPPVQVGFGQVRIAGPYLLFATVPQYTLDVIALAQGPIESFEAFYLNDDKGTLSGATFPTGSDGRYANGVVQIYSRLGDDPSTVISEIESVSGGAWGANARADGTAIVAMRCQAVKPADQTKVYPNNAPLISAVCKLSKCYDWRHDTSVGGSGSQRRADPSTWVWTRNAVVCLVHDEWFNRGMDWDFRFAPVLDHLTTAADVCDEGVPLDAGGTEPRYCVDFWYALDNPPSDIRAKILQAFDGYLIERGDGAFVIKAGKYEEPTVTLNEDRILECQWMRSRRAEDLCNKLVISFMSPDHDYTMTQTDPWTDDASIAANGEKPRNLDLGNVTANGQARRLGKRAMTRFSALYKGYVTVDISDDESELEQRYLRIQNRRGPTSMYDVVVEVIGCTLDLQARRVRFDILAADPDIDDWDAGADEGGGPGTPSGPPRDVLPVPIIASITIFESGSTALVRINLNDPGRTDLLADIEWRVTGDVAWQVEPSVIVIGPSGGHVYAESGGIAVAASVDFRVAYRGANGQGEFSGITTADTSSIVGLPTDVEASEDTGSGLITIAWRNPTSPFGLIQIRRASIDLFAAATDVSGFLTGLALGAAETFTETPGDGEWFYWVVVYSTVGIEGGHVEANPVSG